MSCNYRVLLWTLLYFSLSIGLSNSAWAQSVDMNLLGEFEEGWEKEWLQRTMGVEPTRYEVVTENDTDKVLEALSIEAASALWRPLEVRPGSRSNITWRWKIDKTLNDKTAERTKLGNDYVGRVYVVFEPHMVSWKTRTLCYVWARNEPAGSSYLAPYANSVTVIVMRSGEESKGEWVTEERDFVADYRKAFGEQPLLITAVAIMVDTENSKQDALTWFDDIRISVSSPEEDTKQKPAIKFGN